MKKIKIENKPMKNVKILWGKYKGLIIKPYLSAEDINVANVNCVEQFLAEIKDKNITRYDMFPNVKIVYDLVVLEKCTNLDIEATFEIYDNLVSSGIVDYVVGKIKNYESVWNIIVKSLEMRNVFIGLNLIESRMPNPKELENNIADMSKMINELNEKDPTMLRKIIETASLNNAMATAKEETKAEIKAMKEKLASKK